jgi:hypothetical protein
MSAPVVSRPASSSFDVFEVAFIAGGVLLAVVIALVF